MEKVKGRFSSLDVRATVLELQSQCTGSHLQNIYDINPRTFLFKFTKRDGKLSLLVESGVRLHSTKYDREKPNVLPSSFAAKLRKHLRERRLTKFEQLGFDRVVHLEFGHDSRPEMTFHLYFEFYALGNIILTDYTQKVISLLREVKVTDKVTGVETKQLTMGMIYSGQTFQTLTVPSDVEAKLLTSRENVRNALKNALPMFAPSMIDFCLTQATIDGKSKLEPSSVTRLLREAELCATQVNNPGEKVTFRAIIKNSKDGLPIEFIPLLPLERTDDSVLVKTCFNEAVDDYFYQLEERQATERLKHQEMAVNKKFDSIKKEQESRIAALEESIADCLRKAQVIETNLKLIEEAVLVINTGLKNDMSWTDLEMLIEAEKRNGRSTALLIEKLKLASSLIELKLPWEGQSVQLDVDIRLGGHANANRYYELRKVATEKLERTKAAFSQAMRSAEAKVRADTRQSKGRSQHLIPKRRTLWFERFNWFISSDSYLVISGKDMHQNEYLVKRLLKDGDVYVHADLTGASSVIVKNHRKSLTDSADPSSAKPPIIPHRTLLEAGNFSLCFSKAWEAKIVTSAWWVHAAQVSKTAPSGEYLATGSFMIRGKKNFLPPAQLILSFGFMFILDEESTARKKAVRLAKRLKEMPLEREQRLPVSMIDRQNI